MCSLVLVQINMVDFRLNLVTKTSENISQIPFQMHCLKLTPLHNLIHLRWILLTLLLTLVMHFLTILGLSTIRTVDDPLMSIISLTMVPHHLRSQKYNSLMIRNPGIHFDHGLILSLQKLHSSPI